MPSIADTSLTQLAARKLSQARQRALASLVAAENALTAMMQTQQMTDLELRKWETAPHLSSEEDSARLAYDQAKRAFSRDTYVDFVASHDRSVQCCQFAEKAAQSQKQSLGSIGLKRTQLIEEMQRSRRILEGADGQMKRIEASRFAPREFAAATRILKQLDSRDDVLTSAAEMKARIELIETGISACQRVCESATLKINARYRRKEYTKNFIDTTKSIVAVLLTLAVVIMPFYLLITDRCIKKLSPQV